MKKTGRMVAALLVFSWIGLASADPALEAAQKQFGEIYPPGVGLIETLAQALRDAQGLAGVFPEKPSVGEGWRRPWEGQVWTSSHDFQPWIPPNFNERPVTSEADYWYNQSFGINRRTIHASLNPEQAAKLVAAIGASGDADQMATLCLWILRWLDAPPAQRLLMEAQHGLHFYEKKMANPSSFEEQDSDWFLANAWVFQFLMPDAALFGNMTPDRMKETIRSEVCRIQKRTVMNYVRGGQALKADFDPKALVASGQTVEGLMARVMLVNPGREKELAEADKMDPGAFPGQLEGLLKKVVTTFAEGRAVELRKQRAALGEKPNPVEVEQLVKEEKALEGIRQLGTSIHVTSSVLNFGERAYVVQLRMNAPQAPGLQGVRCCGWLRSGRALVDVNYQALGKLPSEAEVMKIVEVMLSDMAARVAAYDDFGGAF